MYVTTREAAELTGYHQKYIAVLAKKGKVIGLLHDGKYNNHQDWLVEKASVLRYHAEIRPGAHPYRKQKEKAK